MSIFPATKKQLAYIRLLIGEAESIGERVPDDITDKLESGDLLNAEASILIDDLKQLLGWEEE